MDKSKEQTRRNEALQSGADDKALGQDAREFGEGGQTIERPLQPGHNDQPDRDPERDESLPRGQNPSRSKR